MFSKVSSVAISGIEGFIVQVEADIGEGLPSYDMVGYLASEVKEAKERVRIALKNSGFFLKPKKITINLSPADIRKEGTGFDVPIAIAILTSFGYISKVDENIIIIGELSLNGDIKPITGVLPIVYSAMKKGFKKCIIPFENLKEGSIVKGIQVIGVKNLKQIVDLLNNKISIAPSYIDLEKLLNDSENNSEDDFSEIVGQETAKRAVEVAVAGMHNILFIGPPGVGKTMIAKRIPSIMPSLTINECLEISKIYSVAGLLNSDNPIILKRPFRSPHHTISDIALTGGGRVPKPGEISLAHLGILFLDELPEFNKNTIEILRQPLEERQITVSRLIASYKYPASFSLVAAMNPCKCGYYPNMNRCICSPNKIKNYISKISGPMLDRIDITAEIVDINYNELIEEKKGESSKYIRQRIIKARNIQNKRYKEENIDYNAEIKPKNIKKFCKLGNKEENMMKEIFEKYNMSARAYHRILKVARTIADLDESKDIKRTHIIEALSYRSIDKKYWS